jgi:tetratricopeptide (TPR) repeat protein
VDIAATTSIAYRAFAATRYAEAADYAQQVLRHSPTDPAALTLVGRLALISGEPDVAHDVFVRLLEKHSHIAALWLDLAVALRDLNRHKDAVAAAHRAIAEGATDPGAWIKLGEMCVSLDDKDAACDAFRKALALEPDNIAAFRGLSQVDDVTSTDKLTQRMDVLGHSSVLQPREKAELHYTLAQIYRRAGERERFIHHLFAANATQRMLCSDGRAEYQVVFDRLESAFTRDAFLKAPRADPGEPTPIFILGMPRSGTTLMEQVFAAHPDVTAGGEIDYMRRSLRRAVERETGRPFPEGFETISTQATNTMARAYSHRLTLLGHGSRHVTDKTPGNFHLVGLLRTLFPSGRVIHVTREPMDTCFSILQYPFDDRSPHTCDIQLLAYVYARYVRLMNRWWDLFGDEFITIEYERLVTSPTQELPGIFQYCRLDWDASYLEFHRCRTPARTFSSIQVRRPIHTNSVGAWREFADALAPLQQALDSELRHCR